MSEEAIRAVAPSLDSQGLWQQSVAKGRRISETFGPAVADVSLGVACDGLTGEINSAEDVGVSLTKQIQGLAQSQLWSLINSTIELWQTMYTTITTGTEQDKAAVTLAGYTIQNVK